MEADDIYKFIGYSVVVLFFIYVIARVMRINTRIIEALTPRKKTLPTSNKAQKEEGTSEEGTSEEEDNDAGEEYNDN